MRLVAEPAAMTLLDDRDARRFALEKAGAGVEDGCLGRRAVAER